MSPQRLENRVESLEHRVTALEELPARMDRMELQILQLRAEMRDEFSALRHEIRAGDEETCRVLRDEIRAGDEETRRVLREEIRNGNAMTVTTLVALTEQARRETRVLFEDVVARLSSIQEGRPPKTV